MKRKLPIDTDIPIWPIQRGRKMAHVSLTLLALKPGESTLVGMDSPRTRARAYACLGKGGFRTRTVTTNTTRVWRLDNATRGKKKKPSVAR